MAIQSINPATEELLQEFEKLNNDEIEIKIKQASLAATTWRETTFKERTQLMRDVAKNLREQSANLGKLMTLEMGKTVGAGLAEIEKCAMTCDYYADNAEKFLTAETIKTEASESYVRFDPLGIILAVMPWNFPYWQVFRFAAPAIMAGNVALLKHASNVPQCALAIEKIFSISGAPEGVFQTLLIGSSQVAKVVSDPRIAAVTLTGSEQAGSRVASVAGDALKKTVLELGGSDPFIVLADADVALSAKIGVEARLQRNVGQSCISAKRFIVVREVAQEFTDHFVAGFKALAVGDPSDPKTIVGPLATEQMLQTLERQVADTVAKGGNILTGGKRIGTKGYFYEPTVIDNVTKGMAVYEEEVFGPVAPIIVVENEAEAITVANDSQYGLGASLWTKDINKAKQLASKIECGAVFINGFERSDPRLPFGGIKKSGYGRELSHYGIKEFVNIKSVWIA